VVGLGEWLHIPLALHWFGRFVSLHVSLFFIGLLVIDQHFYCYFRARMQCRQDIAVARISYCNSVRLSVPPSVCTSQLGPVSRPVEIETSGFHRVIA